MLGLLIDNDVRTDPPGQNARSGSTERSRKDDSLRPWIDNMKSWMRREGAEVGLARREKAQDQEGPVTSECVLVGYHNSQFALTNAARSR